MVLSTKGRRQVFDIMTKIDYMMVDGNLGVTFYSKNQFVFNGTLESILNLFPESPHAFQGLIVKFVDENGIHHTVKLNASENGRFHCEFFKDHKVESYILEKRLYFFEETISLATMWRLNLSDRVRKNIVDVFKGLCEIYGDLVEA